MMQERLRRAEHELDKDPELRRQEELILNHITELRNGDLMRRVDSLVALNDVLSSSSGQGQNEDFK